MVNRFKIIIALLLVTATFLLLLSPNSNPDSGLLYNVKRFQENVFFKLQLSPEAKVDYQSYLLDKRAGEIEALVGNKKSYYLWSSSLRYGATAGHLTDFVLQNNLDDKKLGVINQFKNHQQKFKNLLLNYPGDLNQDDAKFIQDDINYLNLYLEKLSEPTSGNKSV